ncbi:MAG: GHKL domain-containing protein [Firmicutes bacterium]|nr:GHKL domain-containing protein [Bacillota bacterium]
MKKFILNLIKNRTLRIRALILFLLIIYFPILLNIYFVYNKTLDVVKKEKMDFSKQTLQKTTQSLAITIDDIEKNINKFVTEKAITSSMEMYHTLEKHYQKKIDSFLKEKVTEFVDNNFYIKQTICLDKDKRIYYGYDEIKLNKESFFSSKLYNELNSKDTDILWRYKEDDNFLSSKDNFYIIHKIRSRGSERVIGYFISFIKKDVFKGLYKDVAFSNSSEIHIYNKNKEPIITKPELQIPKNVFNGYINTDKLSTISTINLNNKEYAMGVSLLPSKNWYLISTTSVDELLISTKDTLRGNLWFMGLISVIVSLWLILEVIVLSNVITQKEVANYRLKLSEDMNQRLRLYKHDFNNHLQIIQGLIEMKQTKRAVEYLKNVVKEGSMIKGRYHIGIPELESAIYSTICKAKKNDIDVNINSVELPKDLPVELYDLIKIMTNLIKNAMYALINTEGSNKELNIDIYWELDEYVFEITNNIPKIPKDIRKKIFLKGFTTKNENGNGLGLYIVKKLVNKNGGTIKLEVDEKGNHFIVRFPQ